MKRILFALIIFTLSLNAVKAQSWAKKAANAVFTLKTFSDDGSLIASSNGFFISEQGEAVSSFTPFKNAQRAVILDAQGKEIPVEYLTGVNEMYDVAKFQVAVPKKATALPIAATPATDGSSAWLLPYAAKKTPNCTNGTVSKAEQFGDSYTYYTLNMNVTEQQVGSPVLNEQGEAIGILQLSADGKASVGYAVSALFAKSLRMTGLSINDPVLRSVKIAKALPDDVNEAMLTLYVAGASMNQEEYDALIERFIQKFPQATDGYVYRARSKMAKGDYAGADEDMKYSVKVAEKKDEAHYQFAQIIMQYQLYQNDKTYEPWSLEQALKEAEAAYTANPQPIYRQQQAQILFADQKYDEAYNIFMELSQNEVMKAESYYAAAQCKTQQKEMDAALALLDSAVNTFSKPYIKTAAPYLFARAQALYEAKKFRPAVNDYNEYASLMAAQLNANFYFLREQAEFAGHLYQQALDDIRKAVEMEPKEPVYQAEKASVELRVGMIDEATKTSEGLISMAPDDSDGYLFLGLAQCLKGKKAEGVQNLNKAKELGNSQAQSLIEKYSK